MLLTQRMTYMCTGQELFQAQTTCRTEPQPYVVHWSVPTTLLALCPLATQQECCSGPLKHVEEAYSTPARLPPTAAHCLWC